MLLSVVKFLINLKFGFITIIYKVPLDLYEIPFQVLSQFN